MLYILVPIQSYKRFSLLRPYFKVPEAGRMRSCIRPMHGALKGLRIRPVIRDAKVKSVSTIEVEAV